MKLKTQSALFSFYEQLHFFHFYDNVAQVVKLTETNSKVLFSKKARGSMLGDCAFKKQKATLRICFTKNNHTFNFRKLMSYPIAELIPRNPWDHSNSGLPEPKQDISDKTLNIFQNQSYHEDKTPFNSDRKFKTLDPLDVTHSNFYPTVFHFED